MTTDPILSREDFGLLMEALSKEITLTAPLRGLYDHDAALRTRIAELEGLAAKENSYALSILRERLDGLCTALGISKNVEATDGLAILFEQLTTRAEKAEAEVDKLGPEVVAHRYLRPEVRAFARLMEQQLRANDHKPGWRDDTPASLLARVREETDELAAALAEVITGPDPDDVGREAADVANMALMVADVCAALGREEGP